MRELISPYYTLLRPISLDPFVNILSADLAIRLEIVAPEGRVKGWFRTEIDMNVLD